MAKDTVRDRVWRAVLQIGAAPPNYRVKRLMDKPDDVEGFSKADIRVRLDGEVSKRTVHDVLMTMLDYGLIEPAEEYARTTHPVTGEGTEMNLYQLSDPRPILQPP